MRVHELAKELGVASKDLVEKIQKLGGSAKSHMSVVEDEIIAKLKSKASAPAAAAPAKAAAPKAQPATASSAAAVKEAPKSAPVKEVPKAAPVKEAPKPAPAPAPASAQTFTKTPEPVQAKPVAPATPAAPPAPTKIEIPFPIMVGNLAERLNIRIPELIKNLMGMGIFANVNQLLNEEIVVALGEKLNFQISAQADEIKTLLEDKKEDEKNLKLRPPVVTMMGHVDHGKTSLLDAIRKTKVAASEKGFITQHIGAYGVDVLGKGHVTFLDTPGHEAFTAMRARGANVTDVVVLVVAADDGVMPQTVEAYNHAREAGCPVVVAINKSDLPSANIAKVMTGLQKLGLQAEEWGGKTICVKVSAKTGDGIDKLLEMLLLEAEVLELKANPDRLATGIVIEGHLSKGSGPVATVIVQKGTLKLGDIVVCGPHMGRVRALKNDRGKAVKDAGPSYAVELSGLSGVPEAGEQFLVVEDEKAGRKITEKRILELKEKQAHATKHLSLEGLYKKLSEGNFKELKIIIKADVQGSSEALAASLEKMSNDQCRIRVIHNGVGGINESDVVLAAASDAIILGFHVKPDLKAADIAEREGVDIRFYGIIYEAVEDVRKALEGLLEPTYKEVIEGRVVIRKVFKISRVGSVAGAAVIKGKIARSNKVRLMRGQVVLFDGKLSSLKRFKDDVREVAQGYECGLSLDGYDDIREGDQVEAYRLDKIAGKLA